MHTQPRWHITPPRRLRRAVAAVALSAALIALLAAIPTGSAVAAPSAKSATTIPVVNALPTEDLEQVLSTLPVSDLGTTGNVSKEVAQILSGLPALNGLTLNKLEQSLSDLLKTLPASTTLAELLKPGSGLKSTLESTLNGALGGLLGGLLGSSPASTLLGAIGSKTPTELVDQLLSEVTEPAKLSQLLNEIAGGLSPTSLNTLLQGLLGTTMTADFVTGTVKSVAETLGTPTESLVTDLNLPETTQALTAPLDNGKLLGLLDGVGGLNLSLLGSETGSGGSGGSGGAGGSGSGSEGGAGSGSSGSGSGGSGDSSGGSSGTPGGTTLVINTPVTPSPSSPPASGSATTAAAGKLKILSHKVRGDVATLVLQAPAAGKIALGGSGVRSVRRETAKAERVTLRAVLSKAGVASLRHRHHRLQVTLKASFKQTGGPSSSATVAVTFA
jgi:hypothetical protein